MVYDFKTEKYNEYPENQFRTKLALIRTFEERTKNDLMLGIPVVIFKFVK